MAPWAGRKLAKICDNTARVLGVELLAAAHALDSLQPLTTTAELQRVHAAVRERVAYQPDDHRLDRDIGRLAQLVESAQLSALIPAN
jgi:histidine ammonia-lyase